jgi:hypothetical protein
VSIAPVSNWIETSLKAAVSALVRSGEIEIAEDLGRLLEEPEVASLRLYRLREAALLADRICDSDDLQALAPLLDDVCSVFAVAHCTIHRVRERHIGSYGPRVMSNYPDAWIAEYIARRYFSVDPVVAQALQGPGVFFWDEAAAKNPIVTGFLRAAEEHGVGPGGITFVGDNPHGDTFAVSLAVPLGANGFRQLFSPKLADFTDIATLLIDVFSDLTCSYAPTQPVLSCDQLKLLKALASGRSPSDLRSMPVSYGSLATLEKSVLQSLNAQSLFQAVAAAARQGLLETIPFFEDDLFRAERAQPECGSAFASGRTAA